MQRQMTLLFRPDDSNGVMVISGTGGITVFRTTEFHQSSGCAAATAVFNDDPERYI
jgi:hypothetical protein